MILINSKLQLNWRKAIDLRYETVVVILIDADDGSFKETSWVKDPVKYLPVSRERARRIVLKELEGLGIEVEDDDMSIDLVYRNSSPFYPEWRIIINELGLTFFVSQNGSISY